MSETKDRETGRREAGEVARLLSYLAIMAGSLYLFFDARSLPTSRWDVLGAGAFPQLVFAVLTLLAAGAAIGSLKTVSGSAVRGFAGAVAHWLKAHYLVVFVLVCFGLYLAAIPLAGFSWSTFGFLLVALLVLSPRSPMAIVTAVILAAAFSFGLNLLFAEVFNVFLPRGGW